MIRQWIIPACKNLKIKRYLLIPLILFTTACSVNMNKIDTEVLTEGWMYYVPENDLSLRNAQKAISPSDTDIFFLDFYQ